MQIEKLLVTEIIPPGHARWEPPSEPNFNVRDGGQGLIVCKNTFWSSAETNMRLQQSETNQVYNIPSLC